MVKRVDVDDLRTVNLALTLANVYQNGISGGQGNRRTGGQEERVTI